MTMTTTDKPTSRQRLAAYRRNRARGSRSVFERELLRIADDALAQLRRVEGIAAAWKQAYIAERNSHIQTNIRSME